MIVFYLDTTSNYLYTGINKDKQLLIEKKLCLNHDLSTFSLNEIYKMFEEVNLNPSDIDKIIVNNGPGSFTGIRIGVTIAKTLAWCLNKKITTISSLEAMAESIETDKLTVPIINARRGYVYGAIFDHDKVILKDEYLSLEKLKLILNGLNKEYIFISSDKFNDIEIVNYVPNISKIMNKYQDREEINAHFVNPCYLKLTEAEENKMKEEV